MKKIISILIALTLIGTTAVGAVSISDFSDLPTGEWYYDAVKYVVDQGLYNGTSTTTFSPGATMTRGMFITVLGRYEGIDKNSFTADGITNDGVNLRSGPGTNYKVVTVVLKGSNVLVTGYDSNWYAIDYNGKTGYIRSDFVDVAVNTYVDVSYSEYYAASINWASRNGILAGTSATEFSPDKDITREEMCAALYNYAGYKGVEFVPSVEKVPFPDDASIGSEYKDAVYSMQQAGLINGNDDGTFAPLGNAKRCEVAAIIHRYTLYLESLTQEENPDNSGDNSSGGTHLPEDDFIYVEEPFALTPAASEAVIDSYFDDACFIGHSLAVGLDVYTDFGNADFFAVSGITAAGVLNKTDYQYTYTNEAGEEVTGEAAISDILDKKSYGKVYIFLGVNEIGSLPQHAKAFYNNLSQLVSLVQEKQPSATVYLLSLTPISHEKSILSGSFNRTNALTYNSQIKQICLEKNAYYLDIFSLLCDEHGYLPPEACTTDGIHLLRPQYLIIKQYITTHTIS